MAGESKPGIGISPEFILKAGSEQQAYLVVKHTVPFKDILIRFEDNTL
jgi:hypothetical protein